MVWVVFLAQPRPKSHTAGSLWITRTLPKNGHVCSLPLPWPSLPLQAWSCAHVTFLSGILMTLKSLLVCWQVPLCSELCHHSEGESALWAHLSHISEPVGARDWGISMLTPFPLLLFSFKADPIRFSFPSLHRYNSRSPVTPMFPSLMITSQPPSYLT